MIFDRSLVAFDFKIWSGTNWIVPPRKDVEDILVRSKQGFAEAAAKAGRTAAEADLSRKKAADHANRGAGEGILKEGHAKMTTALNTMNEKAMQQYAAFVAFYKCLLDNDLAKDE